MDLGRQSTRSDIDDTCIRYGTTFRCVPISTNPHSSLQAVESSMPAHSAITGGCLKSAWSVDSKYLVSIAEDDSIAVFQTKYAGELKA